ncbi:prepilin-type N-terminal cleavage/methylation domain-containing protein [Diaphorobacter sp.]|uniref:type IV pilus modification PilV family protein n=1 Tax=Diaphorobacter sp. TaxID=1934310 RepID=UPI002586D242|nr:prepilin-type N-terminal cleavage/methylation domain-containing protein [Diaphorobacter sp.]
MSLTYRPHQQGATLIEILVTLVILLFGLLGLMGISSRAHMAELESFQRIQALQLVRDMASRLNANRKVAACYSNGSTGVKVGTGATTLPTCLLDTAPQQAQALADLTAWDGLLKGQAEVLQSGDKVGAMIGAVGCITQEAAPPNTYLIAVAWQGMARTVAPTLSDGSVFPCGKGRFGDDRLHRVVTTKVQIGSLSSAGGTP